jgi:hypothetical protein
MPDIEISDAKRRALPRKFSFRWGSGFIVEEVSVRCSIKDNGREHSWEPTIQLLQYDDDSIDVRFCVYSNGKFTRMPPIMDEKAIKELAKRISGTVLLKKLLSNFAK